MTSTLAALGCNLALFGVIFLVEGSVPVGLVLLTLSVTVFVVWWRIWEKR
jgi:hypothetical protein